LSKKPNKLTENDIFRQNYLDTIKEVYKPRNIKTQDFMERTRGYLHRGVVEKNKQSHSQRTNRNKIFRFEEEEENNYNSVQDSGVESSVDIKQNIKEKVKTKAFTVKKGFKEENTQNYFILPNIEGKKNKKTTSLEKNNSFTSKTSSFQGRSIQIDKSESIQEKNEKKVKFKQKIKEKTVRTNNKEEGGRFANQVLKSSGLNSLYNEYGISEKKQNHKDIIPDIIEEIKEIDIGNLKKNEDKIKIKGQNQIMPPKKALELFNTLSNTLPNKNLIELHPTSLDSSQIINVNLIEPDAKLFDSSKNIKNVILNTNLTEPTSKIIDHSSNFTNMVLNVLSPQTLCELPDTSNTQLINDNKLPKHPSIFLSNTSNKDSNPPSNETIPIMEQSKSNEISLNSSNSHNRSSIPTTTTPLNNLIENHEKTNNKSEFIPINPPPNNLFNSFLEENLKEKTMAKQFNRKKKRSTIKIKQLSEKILTKKITEKTPLMLSTTIVSPLRRDTNLNGLDIDKSFSFMQKIFDDSEDKNTKREKSPRKKQRCNSFITPSTPENVTNNELTLDFSIKNKIYSSKKKLNSNPNYKPSTKNRQSIRNSTFRLVHSFRKKSTKFLKLLSNLQLSFRNSTEETSSFIFIEQRDQNEKEPLLNLKEILRKQTLDEAQLFISSSPNSFTKSGTFLTEKYNSAFSFSSPKSPKTQRSENPNSVFFINVHPPIAKNDIISEKNERCDDQKTLKKEEVDENEIQKKKTAEMKFSLEEEQRKILKLQVFHHKKLWKLSLGLIISNYKILIITEKEFLISEFSGSFKGFFNGIKLKSLEKIRESSVKSKVVFVEDQPKVFEHFVIDEEKSKISENDERTFKEEDESYEEVFEDGGFLEDFKRLENQTHLKFFIHKKLEGELEPLLIRTKANNFLSCISLVFLPISTKLDQSLVYKYPPLIELEEKNEIEQCNFFILIFFSFLKKLDEQEAYKNYLKVNRISHNDSKALIEFYRNHYLNYFSVYGEFEDEINTPMFKVKKYSLFFIEIF